VGKGYCSRHHHAWRKYGDPLAAREPDAQRSAELRALISQSVTSRDRSACWLDWPGVHLFGYPKLHNDKVSHLVLIADGHPRPEPPSDHACHSCDTPACWNPGHLRWDTNGANRQDMVERERQARGEEHGSAKLTEAGVREIRQRGRTGQNRKALAAEFGVSHTTVNDILAGRTWGWLPD
jgi:hypothetical protein